MHRYQIITGNRGLYEHLETKPVQGKDWDSTCELADDPSVADESHVVVVSPDNAELKKIRIVGPSAVMELRTAIELDMIKRRRPAPATPPVGAKQPELEAAPPPVADVAAGSQGTPADPVDEPAGTDPEQVIELPLGAIGHFPGGNQRTTFDQAKLEELAASIRTIGVLQPIVVNESNGQYMLIAGERRLRASHMAGRPTIRAIVKHLPEAVAQEAMLIENIQREDLNPLDEARAYQRLLQFPGVTQATVAARVGKSRVHVTERLELLDLPANLQQQVATGAMSVRSGLEFLRRTKHDGAAVRQQVADGLAQAAPSAKAAGDTVDRLRQQAGAAPPPQRERPTQQTRT
ncbi:MAG TPA: ParB/RepB/Spo0J family partition protein, partial [Symbiobacteriaceae bacterium]|nr:ParB/RepB/Spo0J family partition protein [Symbiobacteriaceae bacterium]